MAFPFISLNKYCQKYTEAQNIYKQEKMFCFNTLIAKFVFASIKLIKYLCLINCFQCLKQKRCTMCVYGCRRSEVMPWSSEIKVRLRTIPAIINHLLF